MGGSSGGGIGSGGATSTGGTSEGGAGGDSTGGGLESTGVGSGTGDVGSAGGGAVSIGPVLGSSGNGAIASSGGRVVVSVGEGVVDASDVELVSGAGPSASRGPAASGETTTVSSALDSATKADSQRNASAETTSNQRLTHWAASQVSDAPEGRTLRLGPSDPAAFIPRPLDSSYPDPLQTY